MKRTFIAIKIPLTKNASELINEIKFELKEERIKWVESWNLHITLFFIGDTEENMIDEIGKSLSEKLENISPFNLKCENLGVFKNTLNPKALWIGIHESESLNGLKLAVNEALSMLGFSTEERLFKPHLTIGRTKFLNDKNRIKKLIEEYKDVVFQNLQIDKVSFYESILTPKGPIYKVLREFQLN